MTSPEETLIVTARALGELRETCVFVGGAILCVYVDRASTPRSTKDVDVVVPVDSAVEYEHEVAARLRALGWSEDDTEGAPRCRWRHPEAGLLDAMSVMDAGFGFANRWYGEVIESARTLSVGGLDVRVASLPSFIATKIEAFRGRGGSDWASSHDLEDLLTVIAANDDVVEQVEAAPPELRTFLRDTFAKWLEPEPLLLVDGGDIVLDDGRAIVVGHDPPPLEAHARGHFRGDAAGELACEAALERMRAIAKLP